MAQAVESTKNSKKVADKQHELQSESKKPEHLHLVNETNDPNIRVGTRLKNIRNEKDITIDAVAKHLKFRREYIEAIEEMQVSLLPKGFVNPYIRDYARFLGQNPAKIVEEFNQQCGALSQGDCSEPKQVSVAKDNTQIFKAFGAVVVFALMAAGIWAGYQMFTNKSAETRSVAEAPVIAITPQMNGARTPVIETATPALSAATDSFKLSIRADQRAWIEIRGADGTLFIDRQFAKGETYDLRVGAGWTLTTQDAGAFEWMVDGETAARIGEPDQALYTLAIDDVASGLARKAG
jgi:hypothetical protein